MRYVAACLTIAFCVTASAAMPQPRRSAVQRAVPSRPPAITPERYAASVVGVDCSNIEQRLQTIVSTQPLFENLARSFRLGFPTKDEFETTAAFNSRMASRVSSAFGNAKTVVAVTDLPYNTKYSADDGKLSLNPFRSIDNAPGKANGDSYYVNAYVGGEDRGDYIGSNAFGVSAKVSKSTIWTVALTFKPPVEKFYTIATLEKSLAPVEAKSVKENGKLVFVAELNDLPITQHYERDKPMIDDPNDTAFRDNYVSVRPKCAFVVNRGKIVARYPLWDFALEN